jgi:hypothetical protein
MADRPTYHGINRNSKYVTMVPCKSTDGKSFTPYHITSWYSSETLKYFMLLDLYFGTDVMMKMRDKPYISASCPYMMKSDRTRVLHIMKASRGSMLFRAEWREVVCGLRNRSTWLWSRHWPILRIWRLVRTRWMREAKWLRTGPKRHYFDWIGFLERKSHPFIYIIVFSLPIIQFKQSQQLKNNGRAHQLLFVQSGGQSLQSD